MDWLNIMKPPFKILYVVLFCVFKGTVDSFFNSIYLENSEWEEFWPL